MDKPINQKYYTNKFRTLRVIIYFNNIQQQQIIRPNHIKNQKTR